MRIATVRRWGMLAAGVLLVSAIVAVDTGRTFVVRDMAGAPVPGAYVAYLREGTTFALVEQLTYQASPLALLRGDAAGRIVIPGAIGVHWPLVQSHAAISVALIYAPELHNALATVSRHGAPSRPDGFRVSADLSEVRLEDVSADPARWYFSLMNLSSFLSRLQSSATAGADTSRLAAELVGYLKADYQTLLERHGHTPRPRPVMPSSVQADYEKRSWQKMVDDDLAARPLWRDELERWLPREIDALNDAADRPR
jgi:hypothetical protein